MERGARVAAPAVVAIVIVVVAAGVVAVVGGRTEEEVAEKWQNARGHSCLLPLGTALEVEVAVVVEVVARK